jgi:S1-C subfamily serine protease
MITVDHPSRVLRIDAYPALPPRGPDYAFPVGIGIGRETEPPILVDRVLPGSAAEEEGVVPGDEIVAVDGMPIERLTPSERPWALVSRAAGTLIEVRVSRDGAERTLTLQTRDLLTDPAL